MSRKGENGFFAPGARLAFFAGIGAALVIVRALWFAAEV